MTYLVDANVLSEPTKLTADSKGVEWLTANEANLVIDPIIIGELRMGILALPRGRKRDRLEEWFEALVEMVECLPWDATVSRRWPPIQRASAIEMSRIRLFFLPS